MVNNKSKTLISYLMFVLYLIIDYNINYILIFQIKKYIC